MPKVSIIIVNYNGSDLTIDCLRAIEEQSFKDFEVIIVENGSSDNSINEIRKFLEMSTLNPVKLIPLNGNSGFAGGNLAGLAYTEAEYIALLNNDTEPGREWIDNLVRVMEARPDTGICASKMIVFGTDNIDSAGDGYSTSLKGFKRGEGEASLNYNSQEYVFGACAGAALYRRKMLDEIGFLDKDFFLIHEDTDLNFRAQLAGWQVLYVPTAVVYHKVRSSIGHMSDMAVYYTLRNSEFVRIKNISFVLFLRCFPEFILGIISEFIYFAVKHRKLRVYLKAKRDVVIFFPSMMSKRKQIMKTVKVDNKYLYSIMTSVWEKDFFLMKIKKFLRG